MLPPTATAQTSPATATPTTTDYDTDNDGLIEVNSLAQLNAIRHDIDGNGDATHADYIAAFPNRDTTAAGRMGCKLTDHDSDATTAQQATCIGYELTSSLDFDTNGDGEVNASDTGSYTNWTPIGDATNKFTATFEGKLSNGVMPTISNLTINAISGASPRVGLFGATGGGASIENLGLVDVKVDDLATTAGGANVGALVGSNEGKITACYSTGAIKASAGAGSYAGGLVAYNTGTITASFSRTTVDMSIDPALASPQRMDILAGGLVGHNRGTLTAVYSTDAVKGKGGSGSFIGGLVGDNSGTITASYSIGAVTADGASIGIGGLVGYDDSDEGITASYWDYISSGIDTATATDSALKKSTHDLISPTRVPTTGTGTYATWDAQKWDFSDARFHPILTHGGHTTAISGNQLFANIGIDSGSDNRYGEKDKIHPQEGMTLRSNLGTYGGAFNGMRHPPAGGIITVWQWEGSYDGITWTRLAPNKTYWPSYAVRGTHRFIPRLDPSPESEQHVGKYIRAKILLKEEAGVDYAYTRAIGKVKPAATTNAVALSFAASGDNPPRVGTEITIASMPSNAVGLWYRCAPNGSGAPDPSKCEVVGSLTSYTPGAADLGYYLRAYIYYKNGNTWTRATPGTKDGFTQKPVGDVQRGWLWRDY